MAKEDFCFTYYDGDACRDMSHMNRLERGAYHDLVIQQRKFGWLTLDQVKKTLGRDFEEVWPSVNLVLIFDNASQKYYIEWLEKSILEMRAHAKKQSDNRKGKTKINQTETKPEPKPNQTKPLEGGDVNEDEFQKIKKEPDFSKPDIEGDELVFPVETPLMRELWSGWKKYRYRAHLARYGFMGEQADLKRLQHLSFQQIEETILQAIGSNWKGLYPEKNGKATHTSTNKKQQQSADANAFLADYYKTKLSSSQANGNG